VAVKTPNNNANYPRRAAKSGLAFPLSWKQQLVAKQKQFAKLQYSLAELQTSNARIWQSE
jgi:hypothetical protein